jgi:hypothetical protein
MLIKRAITKYGLRHDFKSPAEPVEIDQLSDDELKQRYFLDGFLYVRLKDNESLTGLKTASKNACDVNNERFYWKEKYKNSSDFRPNITDFDGSVIQTLLDQGVPELLKSVTDQDLVLGHVQYRQVLKTRRSYLNWHRDTHFYDGKITGNVPPVIKAIYYPNFTGQPSPALNIIPGSHMHVKTTQILDLFQVNWRRQLTIFPADNCLLVFNTLLLHSALPEMVNDCSHRLIYSFCHKSQLNQYQTGAVGSTQSKFLEAVKRGC